MNPFTTKVFVSATSSDLKSYRKAVEDALLDLGVHPITQDHFGPDHLKIDQMLRKKIRGCDAVVCLVGFAYGAEPQERDRRLLTRRARLLVSACKRLDRTLRRRRKARALRLRLCRAARRLLHPPRRSYTQLEYDYARARRKKVYLFLAGNDCPFDAPGSEGDELRALQGRYRATFEGHDDLYTPFTSREQLKQQILRTKFPTPVRRMAPWGLPPLILLLAVAFLGFKAGDRVPPRIQYVRPPGPHADHVAPDPKIEVAFNEPVTAVAFQIRRTEPESAGVTTLRPTASPDQFVYEAQARGLTPGATYKVSVSATDLAGNPLAGSDWWTLTVRKATKDRLEKALKTLREDLARARQAYEDEAVEWTGVVVQNQSDSSDPYIDIGMDPNADGGDIARFYLADHPPRVAAEKGDLVTIQGTITHATPGGGYSAIDSKVTHIEPKPRTQGPFADAKPGRPGPAPSQARPAATDRAGPS